EKPVVVVPVVEKPVVVVPVVEKPVVVVPVVEKPVVEVPVVEKPVVEVDPNAIQSVAWSATKVFPTPGMTVTWKGKNYQNGWWTQGDEPGTGGVWTLFAGAVIAPVPVIEKPVVIKPISTEPSEFPLYVAGTKYKTGDVVNNAGRDFECKQAPWCSSGAPVYTPGVGGAWQSAWKMHGEAADAEDDDDRHMPSLSEALATEAKITSTDLFVKVKDSVRTLDNVEVDKVKAGRPDNPENVRRFEHLVSSEKWDYLFPQRQPAYTYENMLKAVAKFPAVCGNYDDPTNPNKAAEVCARSMATIFAHFAQETGEHDVNNQEVLEWRQGLAHVTEMGCTTAEAMASPTACAYNGECNPNTWQGQTWQCGKNADGSFKKYFGRGAKQLSYNYNYGPFSQAMFGDTKVLLDNPEWVADTWLNLASAVFFFVTPQPPKPSMLHVIDGTWQPNEYDKNSGLVPGFGVTTMIINGGVECGGATDHAASANRIKYFKEFAHSLNVDVPENEKLGCSGMQEFAGGGAGALNLSWEENYEYTPENKAEKSYACKLVNYQTPYNALLPGDYEKCVEAKFNVKLKD
ncbi:glycoside hydrolase family 19 protein, partial [Glaciimonas sp. GG7]